MFLNYAQNIFDISVPRCSSLRTFLKVFNNIPNNDYIHSLCTYYAPNTFMSNSIGNWLRILIT